MTTTLIPTVYLGGTFGCHGSPLIPLPSETLIPVLNAFAKASHNAELQLINNDKVTIQDSSQLTPQAISDLFDLIKKHAQQNNKLLIIHGTDTLSYVAALLAHAFWDAAIEIVLLASMQPILSNTDETELVIDTTSDAYQNLNQALTGLTSKVTPSRDKANVWMAVDNSLLPAHNTQKINRNNSPAFASSTLETPNSFSNFQNTHQELANTNITCVYCLPQCHRTLMYQLTQTIASKPDAIILIGYGSGNFLYDNDIANMLSEAVNQEIMLVITSQVPFGHINQDYAAGSWLSEHSILSGKEMSIPCIYAKLLLICASISDYSEKLFTWNLTSNR